MGVVWVAFILLVSQSWMALPNLIEDDGIVAHNRNDHVSSEQLPAKLPDYLTRYGKIGKNFHLDENNRPYTLCKYYNTQECQAGQTETECAKTKTCYPETHAHGIRCMAVYVFDSPIDALHNALQTAAANNTLVTVAPVATPTAVRKDCWSQLASELDDCDSNKECVLEHRPGATNESAALFCCCKTHECNDNISYRMILATTVAPDQPTIDSLYWSDSNSTLWLLLILALFLCICAAFVFLMFAIRKKYLMNNQKKSTLSVDGSFPDNKFTVQNRATAAKLAPASWTDDTIATFISGNNINIGDIKLVQLISNGRFGNVYKAHAGETAVAVKMFPISDVDSWICEQCNTISLHELSLLAYTMLNGLAFLHEEYVSVVASKPIIVHRDIKSKNILIKDDLTACITDFGLAVKCETRRIAPNGISGQVGTRRYMSPELLEGAIEFSSFAFRQADVYAASLVLWELLTRTKLPDETKDQVCRYTLPFDAELGRPPSLGEIRDLVVIQKFRPRLRDSLQKNEFTNALIKTMSEMWEKEPDARITTGCARERVQRIRTAITYFYQATETRTCEVTAKTNET